ncbi:MAG: TIGR03790 family protein [Planctomycetota bacterium]
MEPLGEQLLDLLSLGFLGMTNEYQNLQPGSTLRCTWLILAGWLAWSTSFARGELQPDEIAILAMRQSPVSREIAEYYAKSRKIPREQILLLEGKPGSDLARAEWETRTRPSIRNWLVSRRLESKIRCMVTVWDVPLRVQPREPDAAVPRERRAYLLGERRARLEHLTNKIAEIDAILPGGGPASREVKVAENILTISAQLESAAQAAQKRIKPHLETPAGARALAALESSYMECVGVTGYLRALTERKRSGDHRPELQSRMDSLGGQLEGLRVGLTALDALPDGVERDQQILLVGQQSGGILGTMGWIDQELELLARNETGASFDSELALIYWPAYPLLRWQPNVLHYHFDQIPSQRLRSTMMVSRIEAPTPEITRGIIDAAIEVEKTGLQGKVFLDARGHPFQGARGSTGDYDESLRNLAKLLKYQTRFEVILDNEDALFEDDQCPDAALYCGWYSLARYVDAFHWRRGAIGYHLASLEAETLRGPSSNVWCKRMLEDGVCATLGPVFEPYLMAFPRPEDFFIVLMSGRYTLVETYYRTLPHNSWAMVLVGDPLYNPFRANPQFRGENLPVHVRRLLEEPRAK